ncbi:MAG: lipid-binding SYLF domain-containing protein [Fimbriiglobus sp.]|jgi:lipid-binding SYLF domain-containing protein|nr:lipid-binding SYLF domain-containing protein [Fimbriiglobus sp.]
MLPQLLLASALVVSPSQGPIRDKLKELKPQPPEPAKTLRQAAEVIEEMQAWPKSRIPEHLLAKAEAVVIVPDAVKGGLVFAGRGGHGVALVRTKEGWGDPVFVNLGGASIGPQIGVEVSELVLVFKDKKHFERILEGKSKLKLGVDAAVAAGPLGRRAEAATDGAFKAEVLSYSRSRGVFAGVSLDGGVLWNAEEANKEFTKNPTKERLQAAEDLKGRLLGHLLERELPKAVEPKAADPLIPPASVPDSPPIKK